MELLTEAITTLRDRGVLTPLEGLIRQVYLRAADRHEPALGDDAMSFGTTVWRNLTNLGKAQFTGRPGVDARVEDNSLEILCAGYVVRLYSLQGGLDANIESIRWEGSEVRLGGAVENSSHQQLALDDDEQFPDLFAGVTPRKRHLRVAHAGDIDTGAVVAYLGLPRDNRQGGSPWFEVRHWFGEQPVRQSVRRPGAAGPEGHEELPLPQLDLELLDAGGRAAPVAASA